MEYRGKNISTYSMYNSTSAYQVLIPSKAHGPHRRLFQEVKRKWAESFCSDSGFFQFWWSDPNGVGVGVGDIADPALGRSRLGGCEAEESDLQAGAGVLWQLEAHAHRPYFQQRCRWQPWNLQLRKNTEGLHVFQTHQENLIHGYPYIHVTPHTTWCMENIHAQLQAQSKGSQCSVRETFSVK